MTRRIEEIATVGWVDIKEDPRNDDSLFFQEFFEEGLPCTERVSFEPNKGKKDRAPNRC